MKTNSLSKLIYSILFFILGIALFRDPQGVIDFISYLIGGIMIFIGAYRCLSYYVRDKRNNIVNNNELAFGITAIILGILFIFLASTIKLLITIFFGIYLILIGLGKIMQTFYTTDRSSKFYALIIVGLLFVIAGLSIILYKDLDLKILGLFMMAYGIIDVISYFVYRNNDNSSDNNIDEVEENKFIAVDNDVMEAEVVEESEETEKDKPKTKAKSKSKKKK